MYRKITVVLGIGIALLMLVFPGYALQASVSNDYNEFTWNLRPLPKRSLMRWKSWMRDSLQR